MTILKSRNDGMIPSDNITNDIIKVIKNSRKIAILPHLNADGDALGSSIGLYLTIRETGKEAAIILEEPVPNTYLFLPNIDKVIVYNETLYGESKYASGNGKSIFDLVIAVDTGDLNRLGKRKIIFDCAETTVNIDHHATNTEFANINYVDTTASATGEIIYKIAKLMDNKISSELALCLYVALSSDTGGFRYSNTTPVTHQIAAELINRGVDVAEISRRLFDITSLGKVKLMALASQSLEILENGKIAVMKIDDLMMKESGALEEECEGIVNIGRNIEGVEVALLFREKSDNTVKVNLRSNSDIDVSKIASVFSGGGHKKAAGCTLKGNFKEIKENILSEVRRNGGWQ